MPMEELEIAAIKKETEKSWVVWVDRVNGHSLNLSKKLCEQLSETTYRMPKWLYKKVIPFVV